MPDACREALVTLIYRVTMLEVGAVREDMSVFLVPIESVQFACV